MHLKMSSARCCPFCLSLNVLRCIKRPEAHMDNVKPVKILWKNSYWLYGQVFWERENQLNSMASGRFRWFFLPMIGGWGNSNEIVLIWMSLDLTDDKPTLLQVMACYLTAPSHYLKQGNSHEIILIWMSLDLTDDKSTLPQVMACCLTAPSHYLKQGNSHEITLIWMSLDLTDDNSTLLQVMTCCLMAPLPEAR